MSLENKSFEDFLNWKSLANWEKPNEPVFEVVGLNPLCGDEVKLYYKISEGKTIQIVSVAGESCSICSASLGFLFKNQTKFVIDLFASYSSERKKFLEGSETSLFGDLEEISFLNIVKAHPSRHRCALLPWQTLQKIIEVKK
ncbi:iron-sulfur cluster assembly scaffold protein [Leptospira bouyouniensis]|uniref:Iron-sulfur cluster assembly scaffold protein n=1 Tax=Leptospira bouyouniensis TaxID=2484911 RepID=A0ABY2L6U4_9LEPT|nr:iron-sulfur cluster assembly scaffold protein [Leptospira bouyouniensis]TGK48474.1 iron-sulfur cluster assembly scaffold protein [Leptospira bouyouniensis]